MKTVLFQLRVGMNGTIVENMNGEKDELQLLAEEGSKLPSSGSDPFTFQHKNVELEGDQSTNKKKAHQMPSASVMTKLILIMVWRKLIRNPNTYASVLGLLWSLISFKYICYISHFQILNFLSTYSK